jgi:hypothetical protein
MLKKLLATTAVLGSVVGGIVAAAPAASADVVNCRGWTTTDANGVQLDPCSDVPSWNNATIDANIGVFTLGTSVDPCAQLVNLDTGARVVDYGCMGWVKTYNESWSGNIPAGMSLAKGHYVVQEGYWAYDAGGNLRYYDNAQSPVITM